MIYVYLTYKTPKDTVDPLHGPLGSMDPRLGTYALNLLIFSICNCVLVNLHICDFKRVLELTLQNFFNR